MMNMKKRRLLLLAACVSVFSMGNCFAVTANMLPVGLNLAVPGMPQGGPSPINTQGAKQKWLDVPYASQSAAQKLDIYLPNNGKGAFPVILAVHGGGFMVGDKNSGEVNAELNGLNRGYAVVCVNYRLSGEAAFPSAVYDVKAAVRFLKAHAAEYNLDANRIAAWGDSAGGNLVSMLGTTAGHAELEDMSMGNADQSSAVNVVVDWFGPTNFNQMDAEFKTNGKKSFQQHDTADSAESRYMGAQITTIPDKVKLADPETYISKSTVPFFIENGSEDGIVPTQQSVDFAAKLKKVIGKDKVTYIQLKGANHGGPQFETQENLDKVFAFLDKHLKG
jgi:acetyl esterase/lipase